MKKYNTLRNFKEAMQQHPFRKTEQSTQQNQPKTTDENSLKRVIEFFKGMRPERLA